MQTIAPFSPRRFEWICLLDRALWWLAMIMFVGLIVFATTWTQGDWLWPLLALVFAVIGWVMLNFLSARTNHQLLRLTGMMEEDPATAEHELAQLMQRRPLLRHVRLLLYHRIALLRHLQKEYAQTIAICQSVQAQSLGPAEHIRPGLTLTLCHAQLQCNDLIGAYHTLMQLHALPMSLIERLGLMSLQARYELAVGAYETLVQQAGWKVQMAELMPAGLCGAYHFMLSKAAEQVGDAPMAKWMQKRASLLLTPAQLEAAQNGENLDGFTVIDARGHGSV